MFSHYFLVFVNGLAVLSNIFFLFTVGSWSKFTIHDGSGKATKFEADEFGLAVLTLFKIALHGLLLKWSIEGLKTFKPIVKDLKRQQMAGMFNNEHNPQGEPIVKKSKDIKKFKKTTKKMLLATIVLIFASTLYARSYFLRTAD